MLQFLDVAYKIGRSQNHSYMWAACIGTYVAAFAFAGPVTAAHEKEPVYFFWHKLQRNSLHEDFHNVLAIADLIVVKMAYDHIVGMRG